MVSLTELTYTYLFYILFPVAYPTYELKKKKMNAGYPCRAKFV